MSLLPNVAGQSAGGNGRTGEVAATAESASSSPKSAPVGLATEAGSPGPGGAATLLATVLDPAIQAHYDLGVERPRLARESNLEWVRTQELLGRYLPRPPASVLDVGGGPGVYAGWLAEKGYTVRLIDPVPRHVAEARAAAQAQPEHPFDVAEGDARSLEVPDAAFDAVLLMGPLYHLVERSDRLIALREAARVVRPGGPVMAVGISRFASLLDGLRFGWLTDPLFRAMVDQDLRTGQHRNPRPEQRPEWFTTAYFHDPEGLAEEVAAAGLEVEAVLGIEGPGWMIWRERWDDPAQQSALVDAARAVEREPAIQAASAHLMVVARRPLATSRGGHPR
jgi:ubiquinone/menaquinone biosynthesis C-methylase UbiE